MWLSVMYLAANVACLGVLIRSQYYRLAIGWCLAQALTCWQIGIRLFIPVTDRTIAATTWAPGEAVLIMACIVAVCESFWHSLREWHARAVIYTGLIAGCAFIAAAVAPPLEGDAYAQFLTIRTYAYLGTALLAFVAFWVGLWANQRSPRVDRMHAGILAVLMAGHVLLSDFARWQAANVQWRILECLCCAGWALNCRFLRAELAELQKPAALPSPGWPAIPSPRFPTDRTGVRA